jgi:drug/metabolite transporter (DMT)-like permease
MRFNIVPLLFGGLLALIDAFALPILKGVKTEGWPRWLLGIPVGLYALNPLIFYTALGSETLTIMNLIWDLMSDIIVTLIGILFFKEAIPTTKRIGIGLSFISLILMSYEGDGIGEYLDGLVKWIWP